MPHDLAFADAARPSRVACLRLLLQTYSIGHELLLWKARNPLLLLSRDEFDKLPASQQIYALIQGVSTCSRTWSGNQRSERWVKLWGWLIRNTDWPVAIADFRNYLNAGRTTLPVLSSEIPEDAEAFQIANNDEKLGATGRALGAPFVPQLLLFVTNHLKVSLDEAWDFSFSLAACLYFTHLENEGRLNIENVKESQVKREMVENREAAKRERELSSNGLSDLANPFWVKV